MQTHGSNLQHFERPQRNVPKWGEGGNGGRTSGGLLHQILFPMLSLEADMGLLKFAPTI